LNIILGSSENVARSNEKWIFAHLFCRIQLNPKAKPSVLLGEQDWERARKYN